MKKIRFYISGILQGSREAGKFENQEYRQIIGDFIRYFHPTATIYDPIAEHLHKAERYSRKRSNLCFWANVVMAGEADVIIAWMPEASNGTTLESYFGWINGALVLFVSTLDHNWTVRGIAHKIFHSGSELEQFIATPAFLRALQPGQRLIRRNRAQGILANAPEFQTW